MDAFVQVALIEKAQRVFAAEPGVQLCFPLLSPLTFSAAQIGALAAPASAADYAAAADFARVVNFLPRGWVANASEQMLWDVYAAVLDRADVAAASAPGAGSTESDAAASVLYQTAPDGSRQESEAYQRYRQYRDAWFVAREDYGAHRLSGELSDDPAVRAHWLEVEEPALRAVLDAARADWETLGQRARIESALAAERAAAASAPEVRWAEWRQAFMADIDMPTDAGGNRYAPTGLSPRDFAAHDAWLGFELSASEMHALVAAAPDPFKAMLGSDAGAGVQHVTFEYRSVALVRPWFQPEVFSSRIWRSSDPDLMLSDGATPPQGVCPAYASACVFMRKLVVTPADTHAPQAQRQWRFTLDAQRLAASPLHPDLRVLERMRPGPPVAPVPGGPAPVVQPRAFRALTAASFVSAPASPAHDAALAHARLLLQAARPPAADLRLRLPPLRWRGHGPVVVQPPPAPAPAPAPPADDELAILAFICKRLPKAPDPDPALRWN